MKEESVTIYVIMTMLTTLSTAMLSFEIIAGSIMTNEAEAQPQQQPLSKPNATFTTTQNPNKTLGNFDNQTAIHEVINATRNTNATRILAGQIINATTSMMSNQTRWECKQLYGHIEGADIQTKVEELEDLNQSLRNRDQIKDDAIAHL